MPTKDYSPETIRNVAIIGHSHVGKTALADAILFDEGATTRLGHTEDATSAFDTEPEEIARGGSVTSHFGWVEHAGMKINLIDTPGDQNFFLDGLTAVLGADSVVTVVSASDGVQLQTKRAWATAKERHLPRAIFMNKMDQCSVDWKAQLKKMGKSLHATLVPIQIPIGMGESFHGVVDLLKMKALTWKRDQSGTPTETQIPEDLQTIAEDLKASLVDSIVSTDDRLLEEYLENGEVGPDQLVKAFAKAVKGAKIIPVLFGSASQNIAVQPLLDFIADVFPSPIDRGTLTCSNENGEEEECKHNTDDPFLAQVVHTFLDDHVGQLSVIRIFSGELPKDGAVLNASTGESIRLGNAFLMRGNQREKIDRVICGDIVSAVKLKNTHTGNSLCAADKKRTMPTVTYPKPMISYVLIPESKADSDKLKTAVDRLIEEDPSLSVSHDEISHHMVLHGMGHGHLENAIERMIRKSHVHVTTALPTVPYRETFARGVTQVEGKHKKQSGGAGQFGVCVIDVEPLPHDKGFEFVNKIYGGAIPRQYIPSVEKGVVERAKHGAVAGFQIVDFRVTLVDGKYHPVDSKDIAFQMAGAKALKQAMEKAGMKLLEPFYRMEIVIPTDKSGDIMSDISSRRGMIEGMDTEGDMTVVRALAPLAEIQKYVADLHSMTQGKGTFVADFDSYREVPPQLVSKIRENSPFLKQAQHVDE